MKKFLIILLILAVLAGATVGVLYATGIIGGDNGDDPSTETCVDGHTWSVDSKTAAKCYVEGHQVLVCDVCGEVLEQVLPKTEHKKAMIAAKDPTCTTAGNTAGERCINPGCNYQIGIEPIEKTGHTPVNTPAQSATCTQRGYSEGGQHCSVCSEILVEPTEYYPMIGHNYVDAGRIEPTCAQEGSIGGTRCSMCGKIGEAPTEILDKLEEHSAPLEIDSYATCTTDGYKKCPVCGYKEVFEYKSSELHNFVVSGDTIDPDCLAKTDGKTASIQCSNPGCELRIDGAVIPWESCHDESKLEWTVTIPAADTTAGERVAVCDKCGESFRDDIPPLNQKDDNIYDDDIIK